MGATEKNRDDENMGGESNSGGRVADQYLDRKQAAAYLGYSEHYLHRKACDPTGPRYARLGRKSWYKRSDLDQYVVEEKRRKGLPNERAIIDSHKSAKPPAYAFAAAFGQSQPITGRDMQSGIYDVESLEGFESWPDGVYIHPHGILIKRSKWR